MKKFVLFLSLILSSQLLNAQCECINGGSNATGNFNVMYPMVSGDFINRHSPLYNLDLDDGKSYRIIMSHQSGDYICSNPTMEVQNLSAGSNNYTYDFVFDGSFGSWETFAFSWVFYTGVKPGMTESFEFEIRKKILGIYFKQHTFNYTVYAVCNEYGTSLNTNYTHGVAKYEVNNYLSLTSAASNYYSDGTMNFDAGNYINFGPGFSTGLGTYEAYIDGCNGLKSAHGEEHPEIGNMRSEELDIEIYPNPVEVDLTIGFREKRERIISILDESGRVLNDYDVNTEGIIQIDLSHLNPGMYFVKIEESGHTVTVRKILKK